jgi:sugar lactone lactonase YvrE
LTKWRNDAREVSRACLAQCATTLQQGPAEGAIGRIKQIDQARTEATANMAEADADRAEIYLHVDQDATEMDAMQAGASPVCFPLLQTRLAVYHRHMTRIEPVGHICSQWGEGPIWHGPHLYYVDIEGRMVHRYNPEDGSEKSWPVGERVGTVVPRAGGGLVIAGDHGFSFLDEESGKLTPIADPEADKPDNRFNDGKCSPDGRFFAGSISLVKKTGDAKLYRLDPDLSVHEAFAPVTNSNGIAWSLDGKLVYYIDTPRKEVLAFDYVDGNLKNPRSVISTSHIDASPDGMTIDADGNLWIAFCHGGCVSCFDPVKGQEIHRIALPCLETTACAFGGPDFADLFVTTGVHKTAKEEHAGRLFVIRGLGVKGVPAFAFKG